MKNTQKMFLFLTLLYGHFCLAEDRALVQGGTGFKYTISNNRNFIIDDNTVLKIDGLEVPFTSVQGGTGFKARYRIGEGIDDTITAGTIVEMNFIYTHKGPVTSLDPFRIFNIDVLVTDDTFFDNELTIENISMGQELKVSGFIDSGSNLLASRVESSNDPLTEWKLSGLVSMLNQTQFNIGNQVIIIAGVIDDSCVGGLMNGQFVEIKATPDPAFISNSDLSTVTKIECIDQGIDTLPGDVIPTAIEGFINTLTANNGFTIADQIINVTANTLYINGEIDDIQIGVKVEVEGTLNTTTSEIDATKVKFREVRFKFEAPVDPEDIVAGESITILGQTIVTTPQVRDEDGYLNGGIASTAQIEVRGFMDSSGALYATRVRDRNDVDPSDVSIDGQINEINQPIIFVNGILIDTTNSVLQDIQGQTITPEEFFNQISNVTQVEIENASVDTTTDSISGGTIRIDMHTDSVNTRANVNGLTVGLGIGTVTNLADTIYTNNFE